MIVNIDAVDQRGLGLGIQVNPQLSCLAQYNSQPGIYKCPADNKLNQGRVIQRSVSMNCAVGTRWWTAGYGGPGNTNPKTASKPLGGPVGGGWLSGSYTDPDPSYRTYSKITQIFKPNPSDLWVIMDENPDTINDPLLAVNMVPGGNLVDFPAKYHAGAAGIAFADGHSEIHKWMDDFAQVIIIPPNTPTGTPTSKTYPAIPPSNDSAWLQARTSALK